MFEDGMDTNLLQTRMLKDYFISLVNSCLATSYFDLFLFSDTYLWADQPKTLNGVSKNPLKNLKKDVNAVVLLFLPYWIDLTVFEIYDPL